jgi:hypothetical protein
MGYRLKISATSALLLGSVLLVGCGDSGGAANVEDFAMSKTHAESGSCEKRRDDVLGGAVTVTLYHCTLAGVPPNYRRPGTSENPTQHYCFGYAHKQSVDVSGQFGTRCERQ